MPSLFCSEQAKKWMRIMLKRLFAIYFIVLFAAMPLFGVAQIYVAVNGNDANDGTAAQPKATINSALRKAREMRRLKDSSINNGIHIVVGGGTYYLDEPIFVRPEDAGTQASPTFIEALSNEQPIISGGIKISHFKKVTGNISGISSIAKGKLWVADVPLVGGRLFEFRQLWVNGEKAARAKDRNGDSMNRILSWNKAEQTCWIPTPKVNLQNEASLEMFIHQWWAIAILRIKNFEVHGDSTKLSFQQPESRIQSEHPWPAPYISKEDGNSAFYLMNALPLLDEPGEWYLDIGTQKLYYWPKDGEDLSTANVVAPYLETLVKVEGTVDNPVSNIIFKGLSFEHSTWLLPSQKGLVPHQAGMYMLDAYKLKIPGTTDKKGLENQAWVGRPAAAVELSFTEKTTFENCQFQHLASTGLDYKIGNHNDLITGNLFKDIGGTALLLGVFADEATEIHLPYNPTDERVITINTQITNNLITDATNEDWGCVGIGAGYVRGININHNEIHNVSYSGISVGWGWTKTLNALKNNLITANKINHYAKHMYDVAGIYTLSAQPGTMINENYVDSIYKAPYAHIPKHWFYLYCDEGSSFMTVKDNWCPAEKFLQNANGPNNIWQNNGPMVRDSIKNSAGLLPNYQYLLKDKSFVNANQPINLP